MWSGCQGEQWPACGLQWGGEEALARGVDSRPYQQLAERDSFKAACRRLKLNVGSHRQHINIAKEDETPPLACPPHPCPVGAPPVGLLRAINKSTGTMTRQATHAGFNRPSSLQKPFFRRIWKDKCPVEMDMAQAGTGWHRREQKAPLPATCHQHRQPPGCTPHGPARQQGRPPRRKNQSETAGAKGKCPGSRPRAGLVLRGHERRRQAGGSSPSDAGAQRLPSPGGSQPSGLTGREPATRGDRKAQGRGGNSAKPTRTSSVFKSCLK